MIANPCTATLKPGLFGTSEGFLARVKSRLVVDGLNSSSMNSGYLLWVPRYHSSAQSFGVGNDIKSFNLFGFTALESSQTPANNNVSRFGGPTTWEESWAKLTPAAFPDPAASLISFDNAGIVADARVLSACMRLTYIGRMDRNSGQIAFIEGIPLTTVVGTEEKGEPQQSPASVDSLFQMASSVQRLGVDTIEIVRRLDPQMKEIFHSSRDTALVTSSAINTPTVLSASSQVVAPTCFGIAWRGVDPMSTGVLDFELVKNIEWRPAARSGFAATVPKTTSTGPNVFERATATLDAIDPSWTRRILDSAGSAAGEVVKMAATGIASSMLSGYGRHMRLGI